MIDQLTLESFNELYKETYDSILKYVVLNVRSSADVDDIIQNIYISVYDSLNKNRVVNKAYVYGIAKHKIKDFYRFKFKHETISLDDEDLISTLASETDIEKMALLKYDSEQIYDYLRNKNVKVYQIFFLYFKQDYTLKEISEELHLSESNVKSILYRNLKMLKENYGKGV